MADQFDDVIYLGDQVWELRAPVITMTGSDITTTYKIPYFHELLSYEFLHTDSGDVASEDTISYAFFYDEGGRFKVMWAKDDKSLRYGTLVYPLAKRFDGTRYRSIYNSTNTNLVYEKFVIRMLKGGGLAGG